MQVRLIVAHRWNALAEKESRLPAHRQPSQVQLMRGEFLQTALYWAGVVSGRLGAIAEKKISQHSCVGGSVWV